MILGNTKRFNGTGCVCYLDILGFSEDILENWGSKTSNPLEKILSIKNEIPIFTDDGEDDGREDHRRYMCRVSSISDGVIISFGYDEKLLIGDLVLGLETVLGNISYIWSTSIMKGYTIRGAIDFGDIYWDESDLIGPAFINAYRLESNVAKNSRILVSSNWNKVFSNLTKMRTGILIDHLFESFRKDVDGYIIVDPNIIYESESERLELIDKLKKMRDLISNGIVREKYNPLISMLSEGAKPGLKYSDVGSY